MLVARATFAGRSVTLLCVHLALTRAARLRQMNWIALWISKEAPEGPLVLASDFNDWRNYSVGVFGELGMTEVATMLGESGPHLSCVFTRAHARQDVRARDETG